MSDNTSTSRPASTTRVPRSSIVRRMGLILAGALILVLLASLVVHLVGRSQYAAAVDRFEDELGDVIPSLETGALLTEIATYAPDPVAEPENAAKYLVAGGGAVLWAEGDLETIQSLLVIPTAEWSQKHREQVRRLVERNRTGLDLMARAVPLSGADFEMSYDDLVHLEVPNLLRLLRAGLLLDLEARLAFAEGEPEKGLKALTTLERLNRSLRQEHVLIFSLVAHVTEKVMLQGITDVLGSTEPWAVELGTLDRLEALLPEDDLLAFTRKVIALDAAVVSTGIREGWPEEVIDREPQAWLSRYLHGHREAAAFLDEGRVSASLVGQSYALVQEDFAGDPEVDELAAYRNAVAKGQLALSQRQMVRTALELRRRGVERGAYSDPCPDLGTLSEHDPFVGQPLRCEVRPDGSLRLEIPGAGPLADELTPRPGTLWLVDLELPAPSAPAE